MACPPSARLASRFEETSSEYADEGTLAHHLAEAFLLFDLGRLDPGEYRERIAEIKADELFNAEMTDFCDDYSTFVQEVRSRGLRDNNSALVWVERKLDLSWWIPESFGTSDAGVIAGDTMHIVDLKYGKGVEVFAEDNTQMKIYALGALRHFDRGGVVREVHCTIYQPRLHNVSTWSIDRDELDTWAELVLVPAAAKAWRGRGRFRAGTHCRWCPAKGPCDANKKYNMDMARFNFIDSALMTDRDIAYVLKHGDNFIRWVQDVKDFALNQAINHNVRYPDMKIVEGRSNRVFPNKDIAIRYLQLEGFKLDSITKREIVTLENLQKLMGKKDFNDIVAPLLIKPDGKLALVPKDDKRPAWHSASEARKVFLEYEDDEF